ncbi:MAG TPA: hybrid sensor histidine kinase/response regulator [Algoriphagus sp.]|jgi:signal transduction histidine kinase|uniref:hybrid sensor histidine kinase/response regulator n=1 Tax=unclassified Algoriphagus TaxID=2641541 RepID=UPI000C382FB1|nr:MULTISPECIES: ATP-binding protein [unclassified Algoriphagus]MAL13853.1 hybrid sensor histidine kinase/response regulator [Algoriphagus sp.]MAN87541.1 hybrid sensor histidine kinase/response regulator [Algoriphagus sp.]QYH37706.1 hybrid sensor histidine kinase/response regulator [Algoriphagus sp. NBT04N3]HAH36747.1 hybrid sensor histidine kinase/response regulator [Algoriphagus sp.]HAS60246.1 hybrid sensor histidine kinase/response regulator [Algoriphagus sp.]|tara:strand:- start:11551 stop:12726 length:1176 start_codon:yes stop_codon:yes gene_type:complete
MFSLKILIVEDDSVSALLLQRALEKNNHEIIGIADTGEKALDLLDESHADIVMMDINLAGELDGITTTEIINEKFDIPVVYLSASSDAETLNKVVGTNPSAYVIKPFNIRELNMVIELAIFKDRKEKELQKLNNELEEKVRMRTAELYEANKELTKALEKEREINELKSRIVLNVSHGFKTPLTSILSSAQLLQMYAEKDHPFKQKIAKHAMKIENSVRALNNLLTSVLFFGKADANKMEFKPKKMFLGAFVKELLDTVKAGIENDVTIKTELGDLPKTIVSDSEILYQTFENLLSNAVKYSKDGSEVLFKLDYKNGHLYGTVVDNGIGIPKSEQSQLFDRFFRAKNVGIVEGSGLGLSIVKKCIEVMGGEIDFSSEVNKGTTFEVKIPVK